MGTKSIALALFCGLMQAAAPVRAQECQLCSGGKGTEKAPQKPIHIDIETALDFSTAAHTDAGSGTITIDPATGSRRLIGLVGLSGPALRGTATVTGQPLARVIIDFPKAMVLRSTQGATADVTDMRTDLPPNPTIGANGQLVFSFGGKLSVRDGAAGEFHGRIQVTADYQ